MYFLILKLNVIFYLGSKYLQKMLKELIKTKDAKEGIKAFIEKRKPNWENN